MKKKIFVFVLFVLIFAGCNDPIGSDGRAQLKYSWVWSPLYLSDTNPSTPQTVTNDVYFHTKPGRYYMEYRAFDNSYWYMNYQITINKGSEGKNGDDLWFEIALYSSGPILWKWTSARSIYELEMAEQNTINEVLNSESCTGMKQGPIIGREEKNMSFGSIIIEYGKLIE